MQIVINGEQRDVPDAVTISALIEHLELSQRRVAVEVNRELVPKAAHAAHHLSPGDQLEIVTLVGGG